MSGPTPCPHGSNSEEALRESEHRTRLIVSHALDAVITFDAQGHITSWNPQAESLFGWREDEAVGLLLTETVIPPVHREAVRRGLVRLAAGDEGRLLGRRIELTGFRRDGTELPLELAITPMPIGGKIVFSAFLRDITERKQSEERTAELARLARALTESLDMDTVTDRVVTSVVAVFKARAAFISLVEPDGFLCCVALAGNPLNEFQRAYRSPPGVGMAGRAVAERRPVWTSDVLNEPGLEFQDEFRRAVAAANNRSVLVVPLRIKEDVIGVLALTDDKVRTFADDEIGRLQTFADHAALAIRNVQLFSTEQAARAKAATLAERLEVLHETDQAVISGEAPDAIAAKAVVRLRNLLGVPRGDREPVRPGGGRGAVAGGRGAPPGASGARRPVSPVDDGRCGGLATGGAAGGRCRVAPAERLDRSAARVGCLHVHGGAHDRERRAPGRAELRWRARRILRRASEHRAGSGGPARDRRAAGTPPRAREASRGGAHATGARSGRSS